MDYLRPIFHDYLNEESEVDVAGYSFYRDVISKELELEGYEEASDDWLAQRKEQNIVRANAILELHDNQARFNRLKEIFNSGSVFPFVDAGISMPSGYPGWTKFLNQILNETRVSKADFDALISEGYTRKRQSYCKYIPIWYTDDHDESIEALLGKLVEGANV